MLFCLTAPPVFAAKRPTQILAQAQETVAPAAPRLDAAQSILWADGITQSEDLDLYRQTGFNTVVVRLSWAPSNTGEISPNDWAPQKAFALEASKRGLSIIWALPATPQGYENSFRLSADSESYFAIWSNWVGGAVAALHDVPGTLGWMLPDDPRGLPIFDDAGFRGWVRRNYANIQILDAQWGAKFDGFEAITLNDAAALADQWRASAAVEGSISVEELQRRVENGATTNSPTLAFHPVALALAAYKAEAYRNLLSAWAVTVKNSDPNRLHLVFSGRLPDYAQLLDLPGEVDVSLPAIEPGVAEADIVTHNPQAIDIARRGGRFAVVPVLFPHESQILPASAIPDLLGRWMDVACARGARGVGFASWDDLKNNLLVRAAIESKLKTLASAPFSDLWGKPPVTTIAVMLSPLSDGITLQWGQPPYLAPRGLYGFGENMTPGEPTNLVWALRWGTAFGSVDYITPADLNAPNLSGPLERYSTILAPQMLSCPLDAAARLASFVFDGGVVVADLGAGALQSGGSAAVLTPQLSQLFGVPGAYDLRPLSFNLTGVEGHALFPGWSDKIAIRQNLSLTLGGSGSGAAFAGPTGYSPIPPVAATLAEGPPIPQVIRGGVKRILRAPLTINDAGKGQAVFAPFALWQYWLPGHIGFDSFHGDLWGRAPVLALASDKLVPAPVDTPEGTTAFPEIINRALDVTFIDHEAPGQPLQFPVVETTGTGDWLWNNAVALLTNATPTLLAVGRPAPIEHPSEFESRARPLRLYARVSPGEALVATMEPISAQNLAGGPLCATVVKNEPEAVEMNVWPNASEVHQETDWQPTVGPAANFRVTLYNSATGYHAIPGSKHRVTMTDYTQQKGKDKFLMVQKVVTVDETGRLVVEFSGAACQIKIAPDK